MDAWQEEEEDRSIRDEEDVVEMPEPRAIPDCGWLNIAGTQP